MIVFWLTALLPVASLSLLTGPTPSFRSQATALRRTHTSISIATESNQDNTEVFRTSSFLENAKELDDSVARGEALGDYIESTWSNRLGTVLTPVANGVYTGDRPFYWNKIDVGGRMCVIQLDDGNLWVHSPVELDEKTAIALKKLGNVKYIVSPNYEHLKYAKQWSEEYPEAFMWGCPGLTERLPDIEWEGEIPYGLTMPSEADQLKNCWDFNVIVPLHLDMEINPFTGKSFFNEVVFYHKPSKSLITTDIYWNYPQKDGIPNSHLEGSNDDDGSAPNVGKIPFGTRAWKFGMDKVYLPFYKRLMINDMQRYEDVVAIMIDEWETHTLIPCHGDLIRGREKIREVLSTHFKSG